MTVKELFALAAKHGYEVEMEVDGRPTLKKVRDDANLPGPVKHTFQQNRQLIVNWFRRERREEWTKCKLCLVMIHTDHPMWESTHPIWCEKGKCPLKARE
jgi:hypothetical protein